MVLRLLHRQLRELNPDLQAQIEALSLVQLTELGEASLDFISEADLVNWLDSDETPK
ncbi:DUF4351 domain-containing protein [Leptolyngbya sp. FACHB-671]|uniref:DUF4351 domain-containing protein n=1 Tax=Leptolyngbya sp. FACHB-671 TaxID=2692812 RepID=UPI001F5531FF|nr:DUF4351 domain-containing protein [Leptolyngbya sp. FACHB-671]